MRHAIDLKVGEIDDDFSPCVKHSRRMLGIGSLTRGEAWVLVLLIVGPAGIVATAFASEPLEHALTDLTVVAAVVGALAVLGLIAAFLNYALRHARTSIRSLALLTALIAPCFAWLPWQIAVSLSLGLMVVIFVPMTNAERATVVTVAGTLGGLALPAQSTHCHFGPPPARIAPGLRAIALPPYPVPATAKSTTD